MLSRISWCAYTSSRKAASCFKRSSSVVSSAAVSSPSSRRDASFIRTLLPAPVARGRKQRACATGNRLAGPEDVGLDGVHGLPERRGNGLVVESIDFAHQERAALEAPRDIVDRLERETLAALQEPKVRDKLAALGVESMSMSSSEFDAFVEKEIAVNAALLKAIGWKPK